tara:strand:- start:88 stop:471 length:384 start_codon:yes stop_codon:yes gene_type:complete
MYKRRRTKLNIKNFMLVVSLLRTWAVKMDAEFNKVFQFFMAEVKEKSPVIRDLNMVERMTKRAIDKYLSFIDFENVAVCSARVDKARMELIEGETRLKNMLEYYTNREVKQDSRMDVRILLEQMGVN